MPEVAVMRRMQAAGIEAFGSEVQMLELAAPGSPASDELVISVRAAGVGNWEEIVSVGEWDDGRLATITGDPPTPERGVTVADVYVEADGDRLAALAEALKDGLLSLNVGARFALADAATALQGAVTGRAAGATVLALDQNSEP